jgi:hypothetical protein
MFIAALKEPRGDMFWMFPVIGAYMHGKDKMSPGAKSAVRNAWKTYAPYRGDTENHWAMYYASLFLAAEQWGLPGGVVQRKNLGKSCRCANTCFTG